MANRLTMGLVFLLGMVGGLLFGYFAVMRTQNAMDDRLDRIEQFFSMPAQTVPAAPNPPLPAHKGKRSRRWRAWASPKAGYGLDVRKSANLERGKSPRPTNPQPRRREIEIARLHRTR